MSQGWGRFIRVINVERWGVGALAARCCPGREHKCSGGLTIPHCLKLRLYKWSGEVLWWSSIWSVGCEEVFFLEESARC